MRILVTGVAGFIGYHVAAALLKRGDSVTGIDNLNDYYDPRLKQARLGQLLPHPQFAFHRVDIVDRRAPGKFFADGNFEVVIHLAAQAGVRDSIRHPHLYAESNVMGFLNVLEGCRRTQAMHLIYASSSSVYGRCTRLPFSIEDKADYPSSFYAVTKRANELMAECYSHLFRIPSTGLRLFTVYGPWGRPDMAPYRFAEAIVGGGVIDVYNYGRMRRDFTYIDDVVDGILALASLPPKQHRIINVAANEPVNLMAFIHLLEKAFGRRVRKRFLPMQPGDVMATHADTADLQKYMGDRAATPVAIGVQRFAEWFSAWQAVLKSTPRSRQELLPAERRAWA